MKEYFKPTLQEDDGSFWMNEADFRRHFDCVGVLFMCSPSGDAWSQARKEISLTGDDLNSQCLTFKLENDNVSGFFTLLQHDERIQGVADYVPLCFGVYGPLPSSSSGSSQGPLKEVARSDNWASREVIAQVTRGEAMAAGKYVVVLYNTTRVGDRVVSLELHMDQGPGGPRELRTKISNLKPELRPQLALASATCGKGCQAGTLGPFETKSNWLPNCGYAVAVRNTNPKESSIEWDFSESTGLEIPGGRGSQKVATKLPAASQQTHHSDWQLVTELTPVAGAKKFGCRYGISYH